MSQRVKTSARELVLPRRLHQKTAIYGKKYVLSAHTLLIIILRLCSVCTYTTTNYLKTLCSVCTYTSNNNYLKTVCSICTNTTNNYLKTNRF